MIKPYEQRFPWNLDWNLLRTFMVIVDQKGITRAANHLGVRQPTISSALKRLEETVGHVLIDRRPSHFAPTAAGRVLYKECSTTFHSVSQIPGLLSDAEGHVSGHVSIVMTSHVVSDHLDKVFENFNQTYPDVTYSISIAESTEVLSRMQLNQATLGICLIRSQNKSLESKVLFREFFGLYCGPHHRLFGKPDIELSELEGESSVSFQTDTEQGALFSVTQLREQALLRPELKGVSANLPEVRRMIVAGFGIGALPVHVAQSSVDAGMLWRLPPYTNIPAVEGYLLTNPLRSLNTAEGLLIDAMNELVENVSLKERTYL